MRRSRVSSTRRASRRSTPIATRTSSRRSSSTRSATPSSASSRRSVEAAGDELVVSGDLTIKGVTRPVELRGTSRRACERSVGQRAHRSRARRDGRPRVVRARVECSASRRRLPPSERRRSSRRTSRRRGPRSPMRILAISGSLRAGSYNTALARAAVDLAPDGVEVELFEGLGDLPLFDADLEGDDRRGRPAPAREHRGCGRRPLRDAGVQRLHSGRPQERGRLGLASTRRSRAAGQDSRGRRREHRAVRRAVGTAGPSARARHRRRAGRLPRSPRRPRPGRLRPGRRARARSSPSGCGRTSPSSFTRQCRSRWRPRQRRGAASPRPLENGYQRWIW